MPAPILSIMMPSHNYARFLRQAIESILSQEFGDFEFIIIEDGSSDESPDIIKEYAKHDQRIRAIYHPNNAGMLERVNEGTACARGKYIHYLAADDFRYPGFLQKCMEALQKKPELGMCCTQFQWGNDDNLLLETCGYEGAGETLFFEPEKMVDAFLNHNFKIFALAAVIKTELVNKYHGFDPKLYYFADWYLLNEIAFNHPLALILEPLSHFRIHDSNFSNIYRHNKITKKAAYRRIFEKLGNQESRFFKKQIRKSALLTFAFQDLFWKLLFNPKYILYWPYINRKYPIKNRIAHSIGKKLRISCTKNLERTR
jgi:glycosyltransferase involved in cell wall biosynthesis